MFNILVGHVIRKPIATFVLFCVIIIIGTVAAFRIPLDIYPSVDYPKVYITTQWPGASPRVIESEVTSVIEGSLVSIKGIDKIRSISRNGHSRIELRLQRKVNVDYILYEIQEKLSSLYKKLPKSVLPPRTSRYIPQEFRVHNFLSYHVVGPLNDAELREFALKHVSPILKGISGVAGIEVLGGRERQIQIVYDNEALEKWGILQHDIIRAVRNADFFNTAGEIIQSNGRQSVILHEKLSSVRDIETLPITFVGQRCVLIGDVAQVIESYSPQYEIQRINGQSTVLVKVIRESNANMVRTANQIYDVIQSLEQALPAGVRLIKEDDQSVFIRNNIHQLLSRAVYSICAIFFILAIFVRFMRFALVILAAVIASVFFTIFLMYILQYSFNLITLAGITLGFGFLIDNAIVVFESIIRHWEKGYTSIDGSQKGAQVVARPLIAATLTTIAALLPFLYLMEDLSIYYSPFAVTVSLALIVSALSGLFLVPTLTVKLRTRKLQRYNDKSVADYSLWNIAGHLRKAYAVSLRRCLRHPWITISIVIWFFGIPIWLLPARLSVTSECNVLERQSHKLYNRISDSKSMRVLRPYLEHIIGGSTYLFYKYVDRQEIWNYGEQTYLFCSVHLPSGTPIEQTDKIAAYLENSIEGINAVSETRVTVYPTSAYMTVSFPHDLNYVLAAIVARQRLISRAASIGNAKVLVSGYGPAFASGGGGVARRNQLIITGYNYLEIERICDDISNRLNRNLRVQNLRTDLNRWQQSSDVYENMLSLDFSMLAGWHLTSIDVLGQIQPYLTQYLYRQRLRIENTEIPFTIYSKQYEDFSIYQVRNIPIRNTWNQKVSLNSLASIEKRLIPSVIEREDQEYFRIIAFDYLGSNKAAQKFTTDFINSIQLSPGYSILKAEDFLWKKGEENNLTMIFLLALVLMYMVLAGLYESFTYPLLIFAIIPLSLIGVFLIYYISGTVFNQSAYIGTILMIGIIVNNAIFLLDRMNKVRVEHSSNYLDDMLIRAGQDRIRPILMTTITSIVGLLPFVVFSGKQETKDIWQTLSLSTIGGLSFGTIMGLHVLPVLVLLLDRINSRMKGGSNNN